MLTKHYKIGTTEIDFRVSALTPRQYRAEFGRDIMRDIQTLLKISEGITPEMGEIIEDVVYIFAKGANPDIGTLEEFLEGIDNASFSYMAVPSIFDCWNEGMAQTSEPKNKKKGTQHVKTTEQSSC